LLSTSHQLIPLVPPQAIKALKMKSISSTPAFILAVGLLVAVCTALDEQSTVEERSSLAPRRMTLKQRSDKVHGIVFGVTIGLIFPIGAMSWKLFGRIFSARTCLLIHIIFQSLGVALTAVGFGVGVWVAILHAEVRSSLSPITTYLSLSLSLEAIKAVYCG
jgi:hypothetical protein